MYRPGSYLKSEAYCFILDYYIVGVLYSVSMIVPICRNGTPELKIRIREELLMTSTTYVHSE